MKRILFITPLLWNGGAERVVSVLSNSLAGKGYDIGIFVYNPSEYDYYVVPEVKRFTFPFSLTDSKRLTISVFYRKIKTLRKIIKEFNPDVCIPFLDSAIIDTWVACLFLNTHIIVTCRNKPVKGSVIHEVIRMAAFAHGSALFLQTEEQKQFFSKKLLKKSFVVNNPVDERFIQKGEGRTCKGKIEKIISCGRLHKQKNHELLIKSISKVHEKHPEISLDIYGRGPEERVLHNLINTLNAQDYIKLKGYVSDTLEVLRNADLFVLSSDYEGFPNAIIEAMSLGIPVCSTDCPTGPKDLIGFNGERGVLVPIGNMYALIDAINGIIENVDIAEEKTFVARKYIKESFSPDIISDKLISEIHRVTGL